MTAPRDLELHSLPNKALMEAAKQLPKSGALMRDGDYSFLKISPAFIDNLFPLLENYRELFKPVDEAHISLAYPEENCFIERSDIGSYHPFEVLDLCTAELHLKKYYVLTVAAPSLEYLRKKYKLPKKLCYRGYGIGLHITLAKNLL